MNIHATLDVMAAVAGALALGRDRFFSRTLDGVPIAQVTRRIQMDPVMISGAETRDVAASTPAGELNAALHVARWCGAGYPGLIYLHGSGERPFDFSRTSKNTFRTVVLAADPPWPENLVVVRAPFHDGSARAYARAMGHLGNFTAMIGSMVVLADQLVNALRAAGSGPLTIAGTSLGGWATNLHAAVSGSADAYIPMLAGTALDDTFLDSAFGHLAAKQALRDPMVLQRALNFESAFRAAPRDRVFPLLARHDQFIRFDRQVSSYGEVPVRVIERGHTTAALSPSLLRAHIVRHRPAGDGPPVTRM